jgi:hypothetical protein
LKLRSIKTTCAKAGVWGVSQSLPLLNRAAFHGKTAEFGRKSCICRLPDRVMETVQMQTSTANYNADIADKNLLAWQAPRLQVRSIAAITHSGTNTFTDNCTENCTTTAQD